MVSLTCLSALERRPLTQWDVQSGMEVPRQGFETKRFTAVNELIALLMLHDSRKFDYSFFALWTVRDALEYPLPCPATPRQHHRSLCSVPAAVRLIEVAGRLPWSWDQEFEYGPSKGNPGGGGPLWGRKRGFCGERWDLWRRRFGELSAGEWLDGECRDGARRAADIMKKIELE
jgi:hypothetical protein